LISAREQEPIEGKRTFALKVDEEGDPRDLLLALCQFSEYEKSLPTSATTDTLQNNGQIVKIIVRDAAASHDAQSTDPGVDGESP
jgi:hypothetical protein